MENERWQKLNELFHEVVGLNQSERDSFLEKACDGDKALQLEIESLVSAHQREKDFIQTPAFSQAVKVLAEEQSDEKLIGQKLGSYQIIREIGRGGMGTVYLAERADDQYKQQVAIKLIKRGMDTDSVLKRFRHEREILASLNHPNIAGLIDGGTTNDGLPYLVMEYVEGIPVDEFCNSQKNSITERLELFRIICTAVAYAHQRLVIHRDIKPSNILVTADGIPKLLDFGIAKLITDEANETKQTVTGLRLMTPEYASPEQVRGESVTTLSDIYSLGVVLYKLLSGHYPYHFKERSPLLIAEAIETTEPEKPSEAITRQANLETEETPSKINSTREDTKEKLHRRLRGDLDNIVLMAIRKEPNRRYTSVGQFSEDIRRHLVNFPVIARADTKTYRAAKFLQRNKLAVGATALIFLTLLGGIIATFWQSQLTRIEKERAERRFNDVRKLANTVLFDYHDAIKDLPGSTPVRARIVKDALEYLDKLAVEANNDASLQRELATAYERIGDVQGGTMFANLGDTAGAIENYQKALRIREELINLDPTSFETRRDIALNYSKLGILIWETGDVSKALENNNQSLSRYQLLTAENPDNLDLRFQMARTLDYVGMITQEKGEIARAIGLYQQELEILNSFPEANRQEEKMRRNVSNIYEHLGTAQLLNEEFETALANNRQALEIRKKLSADFPLNADYRRNLSVSYYNDGEILSKMNRFPEALKSYQQNLTIAEELSRADTENEQYRGDIAYALIRIGDMQLLMEANQQALVNYRKSMALREIDVKADPSNLWKRSSMIEAHSKISKALSKSGDSETTKASCEKTILLMEQTEVEPTNALFRSFFADTFTEIGDAYFNLAQRGNENSKYAEIGRGFYKKSLEIWQDMESRGILSKTDKEKATKLEEKLLSN